MPSLIDIIMMIIYLKVMEIRHFNENEHLPIIKISTIDGVLKKLQSKNMLIYNLLDISIHMNIIIPIIMSINIFRNTYILENTFRVLLYYRIVSIFRQVW